MIKLTNIVDPTKQLELPEDLLFVDRLVSTKVRQKTIRTIGGKFIYKRGQLFKGRKIKLNGGTDDDVWISQADLIVLVALSDDIDAKYNLLINGDNYTVVFDHEAPALVTSPVVECSDPSADSWYHLELNLVTVEQ